MSVSWTEEQQQVIDLRKRNILVSAAAGSGKTAVLVERIIRIITDAAEPVDIDRLLIVTFTNAAAAEMRERIGAAIEKALLETPESEHLQRQLTLLHNAQITTIDSFCLYVIRNHFHEIDLEPGFRIGDEGELKLLREDVLDAVMERNYEAAEEPFLAFMDSYMTGRSDAGVGEMILSLYEFSRSYPWPGEWLDGCAAGYACADAEAMEQAVWMRALTDNLRCVAADAAKNLREALALCLAEDGPYMYEGVIRSDMEQYEQLAACESFRDFYRAVSAVGYGRLPSSRGFAGDADKLARVKEIRDDGKELVGKLRKQYFFAEPKVMAEQLLKTAPMAAELVRLAKEFAEAFAGEKRRKNLVDFHDLEHFALNILVDGTTKEPRRAAEEFRDTFAEIMIDEYQDSNHVQETILRAISREERGQNNIFMVGDVKQSIYRFRLARPELFMEKYDTYDTQESAKQRIDLHKNFRSREEVLSFTNDLFSRMMARDLGNVEYDDAAALYPGASYQESADASMFAPEVLLADGADELLSDAPESADRKTIEAHLVADRIRKLMGHQLVTDRETGALRPVRYADIVILLRSLSGTADVFSAVLNDAGIPAHAVSATGYFSAVEVQTVLAMLRILDNPRQDIPLTAVLRSPIVGLTDEELALLRIRDREQPFYACVWECCRKLVDASAGAEETAAEKRGEESAAVSPALGAKLSGFYRMYEKLRGLVPDTPIHELLEILLRETGYGNYAAAMPAGKRREANLHMLIERAIAYERTSYRGLFHFVRYIDKLQKYEVDFGEADMISENADVVRIMSIHKSKGLEFPVVFVCGLGKQFNRQDVRGRMVIHPELGLGLDCMDGVRRIKTPTILKRALGKQTDLENLGEELRVLYVALTRAKEKLILTGMRKNAADELARLAAASEAAPFEEFARKPLSYLRREGASGYLDWLLPALLSYPGRYPVQVVPLAELVTEEAGAAAQGVMTAEACMKAAECADPKTVESFAERFAFRYAHAGDLNRKNKYSVSELKHRAMRELSQQEETEMKPVFPTEEIIPYKPTFVQRMEAAEESVNRGAMRGTAVHRVMECCSFASGIPAAEQVRALTETGKLTPDMAELVKLPLVEHFFASEAGRRMAEAERAGRLYREKPFVMGFTAEELKRFGFGDEASGETADGGDLTLIQGIIDVFWVEDDGIVVLDYKTDRVDTGQELVDRYAAQLRLYGEALERICTAQDGGRGKVKERLLYSFRLEKVIPV